jgi:hypothetical protein
VPPANTNALALQRDWAPGWSGLKLRQRRDILEVVVHRIAVSQEDPSFADTPSDIARFFREHPIGVTATGGGMPYPLLVAPSGEVTQTVPLCCITPHAARHNPVALGIGVIGDFRAAPPTAAAYASLVRVAASLLSALGHDTSALFGHDELAGASRDPDKVCPGACLDMPRLRHDVALACDDGAPRLDLAWEPEAL